MAVEHFVFARTGRSEQEMVADVGAAAGVDMARVDTDRFHGWVGKRSQTTVDIEQPPHDFEADDELPLGAYPIAIAFRDVDRDLSRQETSARNVFRSLASSGHYSLLLVYDLQYLLDRSDPVE